MLPKIVVMFNAVMFSAVQCHYLPHHNRLHEGAYVHKKIRNDKSHIYCVTDRSSSDVNFDSFLSDNFLYFQTCISLYANIDHESEYGDFLIKYSTQPSHSKYIYLFRTKVSQTLNLTSFGAVVVIFSIDPISQHPTHQE